MKHIFGLIFCCHFVIFGFMAALEGAGSGLFIGQAFAAEIKASEEHISDKKVLDSHSEEKKLVPHQAKVPGDEALSDQGIENDTFTSPQLVTIVVIVSPKQADGSAWDIGAGADIALCGAAGCYISQGLEQDAIFYSGGSGLRLIKKAGACRDKLSCVFRGVDIGKLQSEDNLAIQPVDVDYVSHNYMEDALVSGPQECVMDGVKILCSGGFHKQDYSLWVLQEKLAIKAGKEGLDYALYKGIVDERITSLRDRLGGVRVKVRDAVRVFYKKLYNFDLPQSCVLNPNFIGETYYVMGLADANQRRAERVIRGLSGQLSLEEAAGIIQQVPDLYWAFLDISDQLEQFALAGRYKFEKEQAELLLDDKDEVSTLTFGWQVKARAKAALDGCGVDVSSISDAE